MRVWARRRSGRRALVLFAAAYLTYFGVRALTQGAVPNAVTNAVHVMRLERILGIDVEDSVQRVVAGSRALVDAANALYIWGHWPLLIIGGVLLFRLAPAHYYRLRNVCLLSGAFAEIALRHGASVTLLHAGFGAPDIRHGLIEQQALLAARAGVEPPILELPGSAPHVIVETAHALPASLILIGSRMLTGIRSLRSVSERVAQTAPCSVLVLRG